MGIESGFPLQKERLSAVRRSVCGKLQIISLEQTDIASLPPQTNGKAITKARFHLPLTISSAWRRALSEILTPPSMRATSSIRSPPLSLSTVAEVRSFTTSLRTI